MPLRVRGEHELNVPPLATPDQIEGRLSPVEPLIQFPSVVLFVQRAQAVKPDIALTDETLGDIARICRRLDGLPLAIELAAAQVKFLPPGMLLAQLERRLDLLERGSLDVPPRQRTMRDAIGWSYDLLGSEQRLFCRLSVFAGGCDLAAIVAVCDGLGDIAIDPLRGMLDLADKSLVVIDDHPANGALRFHMLETIREFAAEKLDERGESGALRQRHADFFLALAGRAEPELWGISDPTIWTRRLDAELDNIRTALEWFLSSGQAEHALELAGRLGMYWHFTGRISEGRHWLDAALEAAPASPPAERARTLCHRGALALHEGDHERALRMLEESLSLWRTLGDPRWVALTLFRIAHVWRDAGDLQRARPLLEESLALSAGHGDEWGIVRGGPLMLYGSLLLGQGEAAAVTHLEEVLALGHRSGSWVLVGGASTTLAWAALASDDTERAVTLVEEGLAQYTAAGDSQGVSDSLAAAGWIALWAGERERASQHFGQLIRLAW